MNPSRPTTIYALIDPFTEKVRYVGKTVKRVRDRLNGHISEARRAEGRGKAGHCQRWLLKLDAAGKKPIISTLMVVESESWAKWEVMFISWFKGMGCDLTNYTTGGEGVPIAGRSISVECMVCGKGFRKNKAWADKNKTDFCSRRCFLKKTSKFQSDETWMMAHDLKDDGKNIYQIADEIGCSPATAARLCREHRPHVWKAV